MFALTITRWAVFGLVLLFALVVLGLDGHITNLTTSRGSSFAFEGLGIATACFTLLTLPVMLVIGLLRTGAFSSMVAVEIGWLSILWVLWLATAALSISEVNNSFIGGCSAYLSFFRTICNQLSAVAGLAFVNWLLLMAYTITLAVLAILSNGQGHPNVWTTDVKTLFSDGTAGANAGVSGAEKGLPPQQQQAVGQPARYPPNTTHSPQVPPMQQPQAQPYPQNQYTPSPYPQNAQAPGTPAVAQV
ncbi:hypothetical protein HGRIS_004474 [Hohenbuehelia grisea]|uniref:MARVEL domain-containing protein n=1 Tax=Hohenbuehelia grisea TaxID=104357 RepID=A0ABR3JBY0_9AGAR